MRSGGEAWSAGAFGEGEDRTLPFYLGHDELVVLHENKHVLEAFAAHSESSRPAGPPTGARALRRRG